MIKNLRFWFRNVFGFSRTETNGAIILIFLMILMIVLPMVLKSIDFSTPADYKAEQAVLESFVAEFDEKVVQHEDDKKASASPVLFEFDPNTLDEDQWILLGAHQKLAQRVINYRSKGGKFFVREDLMKIYGFPQNLYDDLYPFINLPEKVNKVVAVSEPNVSQTTRKSKSEPITKTKMDINEADTSMLKSVKGVGSILSNRIIKYRNSLGGFVEEGQLKEIYGLSDEVASLLANTFIIKPDFSPSKILINYADVERLSSHPYISKRLAQRIVAYRNQHGPFKPELMLEQLKEVDGQVKLKIYPYLDFQE